MDDKLKAQIRSQIEKRLRDEKLSVMTRMKWLVIHDQFFPQKDVWLYDCCTEWKEGSLEGNRSKIGVSKAGWRFSEKELAAALKERGW